MSEVLKIPLPRSLQEIVGSLLFASEVPLTAGDLRESIRALEPEEGDNREVMEVYHTCTAREVEAALKGLEKALDVAGCGFQLVCTGGTYRLQTAPSCGRYVRAMLKLDRPSRLGRASLETLAIIAYRQPITKSEIEEIRGVDVSGNIKTLMDLQLIRLVGKSELPGHPFLYGTTPLFLEHFGLANLQQLNELDPTLQRSNPRLKAASYKKVEKKTELEKAAEAAAAEAAAEAEAAQKTPETPAAEGPLLIDEDEATALSSVSAEETMMVVDLDDGDDDPSDRPLTGGDDDLLGGDDDDDLLGDDDDDDLLGDDDDDLLDDEEDEEDDDEEEDDEA
jgi:segregation and condensation protein B